MSVVGINFGSATGGTGFDVSSTVTGIMANMRAPETAWATRTTALEAQDAVLSSLGTNLSSLSTALSSLTSFDGVFAQKQGAVSDSTVVALSNADTTAVSGTHTLSVQKLATTSSQFSSAVAGGAALSGSFTLQVGTGASHTIAIDSTNDSVAGIAAAINALDAGVTASVVTDSSGSRLSLNSDSAGQRGELQVDTASLSDSDGNAVTMTVTQHGADAEYKLDGISLTSSSNTVTGALTGVTFQLLGTTSSAANPVTLQIANDTSGVSSALATFVSSYNSVASALAAQEAKDSSGNAQPLFGDQTLSLVQSQIASALAFSSDGSGSKIGNLAELGISVGTDGKLTLDGSALASALTNNFSSVTRFFQSKDLFGQSLTTALSGLGNSGNGALALRTAQNTAEEKTLADNKTNLEARLATYQTSLTARLNMANQILQSIPQQLNEMKQIYAAITGYNENG